LAGITRTENERS